MRTFAWHPATTLSPLGDLLLGFALCVWLRLCRGAGRSPLPRNSTMRGLRFACGSASAEAPGVRPIQEVPCGRGRAQEPPAATRARGAARYRQGATRSHQGLPGPAARSAASQEPPGAARDRQGQPGATRSHQEQPGARIAARSRQEPPGTRQEQPEVAEIAQFVELSYVLEHGAAVDPRVCQYAPGSELTL